MKEILFQAYFVNGQDLSDLTLVEQLFTKQGYSFELDDESNLDQILAENRVLGISAVPSFLLNQDISITGAQPIDRWINYLTKTLRLSENC